MKELIIYLAQSLVEEPDAVSVTESETEDAIVYELRVAEDDMGRVIGKHGKIAKAIRSIVKSASFKMPKKVVVEIKD
ncbi:MAG: KH domain-containing protein [Clostridia bacterium]|nr:KH domain-containing protein [Clostridia bacterium]